jgi:hypothetical protein
MGGIIICTVPQINWNYGEMYNMYFSENRNGIMGRILICTVDQIEVELWGEL